MEKVFTAENLRNIEWCQEKPPPPATPGRISGWELQCIYLTRKGMHLVLGEMSPQSGHSTDNFPTVLLLAFSTHPLGEARSPSLRISPPPASKPPPRNTHARRLVPAGAGPGEGRGLVQPRPSSTRKRPPRGAGRTRRLFGARPPERPPGSRRGHAAEPAELAGRLPPNVR